MQVALGLTAEYLQKTDKHRTLGSRRRETSANRKAVPTQLQKPARGLVGQ